MIVRWLEDREEICGQPHPACPLDPPPATADRTDLVVGCVVDCVGDRPDPSE